LHRSAQLAPSSKYLLFYSVEEHSRSFSTLSESFALSKSPTHHRSPTATMNRAFNPEWCDSENPPDDPGDVTVYDESSNLTYIARVEYDYRQWRQLLTQWNTICVSIDGACAGNGRVDVEPRAASAVYFGPDSVYNWAGVLDRNVHRQTNVYADIFAVVRALRIFRKNRAEGRWHHVDGIIVVRTPPLYPTR
jgi:hypothetical protein